MRLTGKRELCPSVEGLQIVFRCLGRPRSKHRKLELLLQLVDLTVVGASRRPKPRGEDNLDVCTKRSLSVENPGVIDRGSRCPGD